MAAQQLVDGVVVDQPEGEGRHIGVAQEVQKVVDAAGQPGVIPQGQRLVDGVGQAAGLGQDVLDAGGNGGVGQKLAVVHHEAVVKGGSRLQIGAGRIGEVRLHIRKRHHGMAIALGTLLMDHLSQSHNGLAGIGEHQVQVGLDGHQLHAEGCRTGNAVKGRLAQVKGLVVALGLHTVEDDGVIRPVDAHAQGSGGGHHVLPGLIASLHELHHKIVALHGQGALQAGDEVGVAGAQLPDARLDGGELVHHTLLAGEHGGDLLNGTCVAPGQQQRHQQPHNAKPCHQQGGAHHAATGGLGDGAGTQQRNVVQIPGAAG